MAAYVAPLAGAWIEICYYLIEQAKAMGVAPLAGAWIEIFGRAYLATPSTVAPLAGAWIEMLRLSASR